MSLPKVTRQGRVSTHILARLTTDSEPSSIVGSIKISTRLPSLRENRSRNVKGRNCNFIDFQTVFSSLCPFHCLRSGLCYTPIIGLSVTRLKKEFPAFLRGPFIPFSLSNLLTFFWPPREKRDPFPPVLPFPSNFPLSFSCLSHEFLCAGRRNAIEIGLLMLFPPAGSFTPSYRSAFKAQLGLNERVRQWKRPGRP